ncbi:MAG TPA: hypothetical protein VHZ04_03685 [Candidatus Paceibacterota bacterium]|jgi:hypothetical protein|nr:hypothetical protein [Candidatus Paceibacterota bacterium]
MDQNLVPTSGEFPVLRKGDHYEFNPPLRVRIGRIECELRRVDTADFEVKEDEWNNRIVAIPKLHG